MRAECAGVGCENQLSELNSTPSGYKNKLQKKQAARIRMDPRPKGDAHAFISLGYGYQRTSVDAGLLKPPCILFPCHPDLPLAAASCPYGYETGRLDPPAAARDVFHPEDGCGISRCRSAADIPGRARRGFSYGRNRCPPFPRQSFCRYFHPFRTLPNPFGAGCRSDGLLVPWPVPARPTRL